MTDPARVSLRFPPGFLHALTRGIARAREPAEAALLLREIGYEAGHGFYAALEERISRTHAEQPVAGLSPEQFWDGLSSLFEEHGWGRLRWTPAHRALASLESPDWAESEARDEPYPACHFTTGLLADLLSRVAGGEVAVLETECRARGDAQCRFLCGGEATLERLHQVLRRGVPVQEALDHLD